MPRIEDTGDGTVYSKRSYGPHAAIVLNPTSGDALTAKNRGRTGLLIHSGAPGASGKLRATHGCIRLSDEDMASLLQAIDQAGDDEKQLICKAVRISVVVGKPVDEGAGNDESDPPPNILDLLIPRSIGRPLP